MHSNTYQYHGILPFVETAPGQQKHGGRKKNTLISSMVSVNTKHSVVTYVSHFVK